MGSYNQFKVTLPRLGINVKFAKDDEPASFESLIDANTKALYVGRAGGRCRGDSTTPSHVIRYHVVAVCHTPGESDVDVTRTSDQASLADSVCVYTTRPGTHQQ